jgi:acyl dehydratase
LKEAVFNQLVDKWFDELSCRKGETTVPGVGSCPPDLKTGLHSSLNNEYVTTDLIRHYAEAIGDRNPLWRYEDYARKTVWGGIIAPPTITDAIAISWPTKRGALTDLDFDLAGLPAGSKREWFGVIRPGDKFRLVDELINIEEKKTKQKGIIRLFLETIKRSYINQRDEAAAIVHCRMVHLAIPPREDGSGGTTVFSGGERTRHVFTDAEREAIYNGYDTETRRGSDTLFWDDVTVGQELKPLVVGPVTTWHTAAWLAALAGYAVAFDMEWETLKADLKFAWFDPKLNVWKSGGEGHLVDGAGHSGFSGGHAFAYGAQIEGLICRSIYNWMGDAGFLKEMDCAFRNIPILGDAYHIHGSVTNKYTAGDEHLVDLKVHCENQDGLVLVPGTAKVRLPAR